LQDFHAKVEKRDECLVLVSAQHLIEKRAAGAALAVDHGGLASTRIHQETDRQREVRFARKILDGLRNSILFDMKIFPVQVCDDGAIPVVHRREQCHNLHFSGEYGLLREGADSRAEHKIAPANQHSES
jgi:hypothetical protein